MKKYLIIIFSLFVNCLPIQSQIITNSYQTTITNRLPIFEKCIKDDFNNLITGGYQSMGFSYSYIVINKFNNNAGFLWNLRIDYSGYIKDLTSDNEGNLYLLCKCISRSGNFKFIDPDSKKEFYFNESNLSFLMKLNSSGNILWVRNTDEFSKDGVIYQIQIDNDKNMYLLGDSLLTKIYCNMKLAWSKKFESFNHLMFFKEKNEIIIYNSAKLVISDGDGTAIKTMNLQFSAIEGYKSNLIFSNDSGLYELNLDTYKVTKKSNITANLLSCHESKVLCSTNAGIKLFNLENNKIDSEIKPGGKFTLNYIHLLDSNNFMILGSLSEGFIEIAPITISDILTNKPRTDFILKGDLSSKACITTSLLYNFYNHIPIGTYNSVYLGKDSLNLSLRYYQEKLSVPVDSLILEIADNSDFINAAKLPIIKRIPGELSFTLNNYFATGVYYLRIRNTNILNDVIYTPLKIHISNIFSPVGINIYGSKTRLEKGKVLFIGSNPKGTDKLQLGNEILKIKNNIGMDNAKLPFEFKYKEESEIKDLIKLTIEFDPEIVSFLGMVVIRGLPLRMIAQI